ncbi:hypothetical protein Vafri_4210 [Volvox africanus]|uniref:Metallo-beta-lactamase domain-containing protein n=1 Tax=Volvox africanus TaxID=51714 RepID=A0A8J4ATQ0_9CHLO|nr:hypothetical protein Vafri_4210 [Volvox africanus]
MASQVERIKWVPGTDFLVDGFAFKNTRCSHYFLTHFHSDHTVGLNKSFNGGVIYCSHITARLLVHDMGIRPQLVKPLALGTAVIVEGVRVTPLDANHCPGSVMFLFEVPSSRVNKSQPLATTTSPATRVGTPGFPANHPTVDSPPARAAGATVTSVASTDETQDVGADGAGDGSALSAVCAGGDVHDASECGGRAAAATHNILHTGDCRWQRWMRNQPGLDGVRVDTVILDTTYAAPKHVLPPQEDAVNMMVQCHLRLLGLQYLSHLIRACSHLPLAGRRYSVPQSSRRRSPVECRTSVKAGKAGIGSLSIHYKRLKAPSATTARDLHLMPCVTGRGTHCTRYPATHG